MWTDNGDETVTRMHSLAHSSERLFTYTIGAAFETCARSKSLLDSSRCTAVGSVVLADTSVLTYRCTYR